jgi:hypothetical protein
MHGVIPPFPQHVFMAWCLVKNRDNSTFLPQGKILTSVLAGVKCLAGSVL